MDELGYLAREMLKDVAEEIASSGDGSVILRTDDFTIYDGMTLISPFYTMMRVHR